MDKPTPALVTQRGARQLPRLALLLLCAAYVLPGVFGRDPWRNADITAFGSMLSVAEGRSPWLAPAIGGVPIDAPLLSHWLGSIFIKLLTPWVDPALAARVPFAALLGLVLALTWYSTFHLARTDAAKPVSFAFGGEADPVAYARAIADGAVLALIASLGLLQLGHETTPELAQLFGVSLLLWSLAACARPVWRARAAAIVAMVVLAGSGAPSMALAMGLGGALVGLRSHNAAVRAFSPWVLLATACGSLLAWALGIWEWRIDMPDGLRQVSLLGRMWLWFMWPAWLLAVWTLWRWRRHLHHRHVAAPLVTVIVALLASLSMAASERALLLGLPGLAVLAAFALPTLDRSASAAIDWFAMLFFTVFAGALWVIYVSVQTGFPPQPAANVAKLAPGFVAQFSAVALVFATAATVCWIWLVRWRTGRHRDAIWKSLVLSASGVTLCWLLLMTLGLPILDYARSSRALVHLVARHVPATGCVAAPGQRPAFVAALEYFGRFTVDARDSAAATPCRFLVQQQHPTQAPAALDGWTLIAREQRPTDRGTLAAIYRRDTPQRGSRTP